MLQRSEGFFSRAILQRGVLLGLIVALGYFIPNNYILFPLHQVVITRVDHWIELQPAWIWFYISYYLILIWAYFVTTGTVAQRVYFGAMSLASAVGYVVFTFFPTTVSRELYPWLGEVSVSAKMLAHIRGADFPVNCLPSMHVGMSFIAASCITLVAGRVGRALVWMWFLAIAYSTMATKQHYFVDVLAGFGLGMTCVAIFMRRHGVLPDFADWLPSSTSSHDHFGVSASRSAGLRSGGLTTASWVGTSVRADAGSGVRADVCTGLRTDVGTGLRAGVRADVGTGLRADVGSGARTGVRASVRAAIAKLRKRA